LPTTVTLDTVKTIEYLRFAAGVSQCYAIVNVRSRLVLPSSWRLADSFLAYLQRIDRLMLVSKALVGEKYILYGLSRHRRQSSAQSDDEADDEERQWLQDSTPRDSIDDMV
jgi:hypothetical protein